MTTNRLLATSLLLFAFAGWVQGQDAVVSLKENDSGACTLEGHFFVEAPISVVWGVLTDYDHIAHFVSSMKESRVLSHTDNVFFVEQRAKGEFLFFARTVYVLLDIHESPFESILFEDTAHTDFDYYSGSWNLKETRPGVLVHYSLNVKSSFSVPGFIKRRVVKRSALELLEQVKSEIVKRTITKDS